MRAVLSLDTRSCRYKVGPSCTPRCICTLIGRCYPPGILISQCDWTGSIRLKENDNAVPRDRSAAVFNVHGSRITVSTHPHRLWTCIDCQTAAVHKSAGYNC